MSAPRTIGNHSGLEMIVDSKLGTYALGDEEWRGMWKNVRGERQIRDFVSIRFDSGSGCPSQNDQMLTSNAGHFRRCSFGWRIAGAG